MLCIVAIFVKCITNQGKKKIYNSVIIDNFLNYFSYFRDNWQDMMTEEIKSLFRKANRQVDKPKIWEAQGC